VVLALPRGGVPVAAEVARALRAPLDLLMVRKIGAPGQREVAVAAVVDGDHPEIVVDEESLRLSGADRAYVDAEAAHELKEIERRRALYLRGRAPVLLAGKSVVLVDDGIATGTTVRAALKALQRSNAARTALRRVFQRTAVVVDDAALRSNGTSGPATLQPGSLRWFTAVARARGEAEGFHVRFLPEAPAAMGWDPAGAYRPFSDTIERLESLTVYRSADATEAGGSRPEG